MSESQATTPQATPAHRRTPGSQAATGVATALTQLLADMLALHLKTMNFHWHVSGGQFRDHHRLFGEQARAILAGADAVAGRTRKLGRATVTSIGHVARLQRVLDNDAEFVTPADMLAELRDDNLDLAGRLRQAHAVADAARDHATAGLIATWIDEAEGRAWFLFEAGRQPLAGG
jgi:starvation-inducible DNA-binding protein